MNSNLERHIKNLVKYIKDDSVYQRYKKNQNSKFDAVDMEEVKHCMDIEQVLKALTQTNENTKFEKSYNYNILANEGIKKKVAKYSKNGEFIEQYESISEASKKTGISTSVISCSANEKSKTGGGYIWHFI